MSHSYPSDIDREQFNKIKPILESTRKRHGLEQLTCMMSFVVFRMF